MQVQIIQKIRFNFGACQKQYDKRIRQKSKLKKSNEHFVHQISSFLIFAMLLVIVMIYSDFLVEMVLHLFGGDFSSGIFFVEIFLQIFFGRQMSLKRLFGRNDFFLFAKCLFRASLVLFCERNSGEKLFERFWGRDFSSDNFFIEMSL